MWQDVYDRLEADDLAVADDVVDGEGRAEDHLRALTYHRQRIAQIHAHAEGRDRKDNTVGRATMRDDHAPLLLPSVVAGDVDTSHWSQDSQAHPRHRSKSSKDGGRWRYSTRS